MNCKVNLKKVNVLWERLLQMLILITGVMAVEIYMHVWLERENGMLASRTVFLDDQRKELRAMERI
ncbi:hypothetical protein HanLR1_Chr06g0202061 [Helianthus annuus]|nr:hypothetical protein HanHA89_Chr16g0666161 [Helianthus annuus]KAJ0736998.1 hypothetical protein HanLR1_Chr06g0202061 [Helianthus annuus]